MSKKDYVRIADIMKRAQMYANHEDQWNFILVGLANYMKETDPRFDEGKFADACGL